MNKKYFETKTGSIEEKITQIATEQSSITKPESNVKLTVEKSYFGVKPGSISDVAAKIVSEGLDPVNKDAVKKKFDDRKDKDIDNDGDVDSTDKYLHKRRAAISKATSEAVMPDDKGEKINQMKHQKAKEGEKDIIKPISEDDMAKFHKMQKDGKSANDIAKALGLDVKSVKKLMDLDEVNNPYAVGMAQAMKAKNDEPPLKKSTITKAHDIAKSIMKKEEIKEARWAIEGRVSYRGIGSEDSFYMVIDAPSKDAAERKAYNELDKARQRRKIGPGGGGSIDDADIESIEKTNDKLSSPESGPMMNSYDPKLKEDFFVNDKKDTLKKFSGRIGYNKSTLTDYLAKKTGKNKNDVYFDDTELVYKDKNVLRNAETKTVDQMLKALQKEEVHPHVKKMVKDGESDAKIKKMHPELKDDELEKLKETHMSTAKSQNQRQREVGGEKEPIKTSKNEWKTFAMMAAELREKKEEKKEQEAGEDTRDMKKKTMTGQVATSPEMNPRVDYKY